MKPPAVLSPSPCPPWASKFVVKFLLIPRDQPPRRLTLSLPDWEKLVAKLSSKGERRDVFDSATVMAGRLERHVTTINLGETPQQPNRHPEDEHVRIKAGTPEVRINRQSQNAGAEGMFFYGSKRKLKRSGQLAASAWRLTMSAPVPPHPPATDVEFG
jgi:hypothetical protein